MLYAIFAATCNGVQTSFDYGCEPKTDTVSSLLVYAINFLAIGVGIAVVAGIVIGAIQYTSANGNQANAQEGIKKIVNSIIGLLLFIFMYAIVDFLLPGGAFNSNVPVAPPTAPGETTPKPTEPGTPDPRNPDPDNPDPGTPDPGNPAPGENGTEEKTTYTLATWNMGGDSNKNDIGKLSKSLITGGVEILGIQEAHLTRHKDNIQAIACSSCDIDAYIPGGGGAGPGGYPILWNKKTFTRVGQGSVFGVKPPGLHNRYINWVKLRNKDTGKSIYVLNVHMPSGLSNDANITAYKTMLGKLYSQIKSKQSDDTPLFVVGDMNADYNRPKCNENPWRPPCEKLSSSYNVYASWHYTGESPAGTFSGNRAVDWVAVWKRSDITVDSAGVIGGTSWGGSDHGVATATVTMRK